MTDRARPASPAGSLLREPTLHFVLLASLLFAARSAFASGGRNVVEVDRGEVAARIRDLEAQNGAALTADERQQVEDGYVDERVLVREALAMGLEDDPRVTDFLVQKMLHVLSADVIQPTDAELLAYYDGHRARYVPVPSVTLDEVVFDTSDPLPPTLATQLEEGVEAGALKSALGLRHNRIESASVASLASAFGAETAARIAGAKVGEWVGPHQTVRGQHWFHVAARSAEAPAPLEVVREQVRLDWIQQEEEARLQARVKELRERYSVVFVGEEGA